MHEFQYYQRTVHRSQPRQDNIGPVKSKIVIIFLPISLNIYDLGTQKNFLIETVLLSTHNICFG